MAKIKQVKEVKKEEKKKTKKKFKINFAKVFVWLALIAMVGSALLAILSPALYGSAS